MGVPEKSGTQKTDDKPHFLFWKTHPEIMLWVTPRILPTCGRLGDDFTNPIQISVTSRRRIMIKFIQMGHSPLPN